MLPVLPLTPDAVKEYALHQVGCKPRRRSSGVEDPPTGGRLYIDNGNVGELAGCHSRCLLWLTTAYSQRG